MTIVKVLQIILYLLAIALLIWAASPPGPRGRRWRIELIAFACALAAYALPLLASAAG